MDTTIKQYTEYSPENREALKLQGKTDDQIADMWSSKNPALRNSIEKIRQNSNNDPLATTGFLNMYLYGDANFKKVDAVLPPENTKMGILGTNALKRFMDKTWEHTQTGIDKEREIIADLESGKIGTIHSMIKGAANAVNIGTGPAKALWETALTTDIPLTNTSGSDIIGNLAQPIMETQLVQNTVAPTLDAWQQWAAESEYGDTANEIAKAGFGVLDLTGAGLLQKPFAAGMQAVKNPLQTTKSVAGSVRHPIQTYNNLLTPKQAVTQTISKDALTRAGVDQRLAKLIVESPADRTSMAKMIDAFEEGATDFNAINPKEIVGETVLMNYKHLKDVKKGVGEMIGNIVEVNKTNPVQFSGTQSKFLNWIEENKIFIDDKGKLTAASSRVPKSDITYLQEVWNRINGTMNTFDDGHQTRQWLFNTQKLADKRQAGYSDLAKDAAKKVHSAIMDDMAQLSPAYKVYAEPFAKISSKAEEFASFLGKSSIDDLTERELRAGELAKRLTGESSSKAEEIFGSLEDLAREYGFTDGSSIQNQAFFERFMRQYFPNQSLGGLTGEMELATKGLGVAKDVATGNKLNLLGKGIKAVMGKSEKKQLELIKKLLKSNLDDLSNASTPADVEKILQDLLGEYYVPPTSRLKGKQAQQAQQGLPQPSKLPNQEKLTYGETLPDNTPPVNTIDDIPSQTLDDVMQYADDSVKNSIQESKVLDKATLKADLDNLKQYINDIDAEIGIKQSMVDSLPVSLEKYVDKSTGRLPEYGSTKTGKNGVKYRNDFQVNGDKIAQELGFEDVESLRDYYERVTQAKSEITSLRKTRAEANAEIKNLSSKVNNFDKPLVDKKLQKKFPTLTPEEIMNLTPEERATGIIAGGGDNMSKVATTESRDAKIARLMQREADIKKADTFAMSDRDMKFQGMSDDAIKTKAMREGRKLDNVDTNLLEEAKKYKSAEEFVKAQGTPVYHGTNAEFDRFDTSKIGTQTDDGMFGKGFYFTPNKKMAGSALRGGDAKFIKEVYLKLKNPLELNQFKTIPELAEHLGMSESAFLRDSYGIRPLGSQIGQFTSHVKDLGYDGIYIRRGVVGDEIVVFAPEAINSKSQLTDIWKKANKK